MNVAQCRSAALAIAIALCFRGFLGCGSSIAHSSKPAVSHEEVAPKAFDTRALDAYVAAFGKNWGESSAFSGYVAVARGGEVVFGKAYGASDREKSIQADRETLFRIGSLSKPFTAIGILQLAERGLVRLDDSIRTYLPELPPIADSVTLRQCLTHTSGLPPLAEDPSLVVETGATHPIDKALAPDAALRFTPGARFEYSNAGFTILAAIVERVSKQSYEAYFQEHVFAPAGMTRTTTVARAGAPNAATGYVIDGDAISHAAPISYVTFGSGSILSTAHDLVAFDRALAGTALLSEPSKLAMFTPGKDAGSIVAGSARYGYGWFLSEDAGHLVESHPGGVSGFEVSFARVPDSQLAVVVLSNLEGSQGIVAKIDAAARELALTGNVPTPVDEPAIAPFDAAQLHQLDADYRMDAPSLEAMRAALPRDLVDSFVGLSLIPTSGKLFASFLRGSDREVFRTPSGSLFTKRGLSLTPELHAGARLASLTLTWADHPELRALYVPLGVSSVRDASAIAACPAGMVRVVGSAAVPSFCMDATEVTVDAYARCVRTGACVSAPSTPAWTGISTTDRATWSPSCNANRKDRQTHPVNCVTWAQSASYCHAQDKRLPTESEWQWAARGGDEERTYPWGYRSPRAPSSNACWSGAEKRDGTCTVGSFASGDALGGIHDLAGNVWEWTSQSTPAGAHVLKGSGWNETNEANLRSDGRLVAEAGFRGPNAGFRCAR